MTDRNKAALEALEKLRQCAFSCEAVSTKQIAGWDKVVESALTNAPEVVTKQIMLKTLLDYLPISRAQMVVDVLDENYPNGVKIVEGK